MQILGSFLNDWLYYVIKGGMTLFSAGKDTTKYSLLQIFTKKIYNFPNSEREVITRFRPLRKDRPAMP